MFPPRHPELLFGCDGPRVLEWFRPFGLIVGRSLSLCGADYPPRHHEPVFMGAGPRGGGGVHIKIKGMKGWVLSSPSNTNNPTHIQNHTPTPTPTPTPSPAPTPTPTPDNEDGDDYGDEDGGDYGDEDGEDYG